MTQTPRQKKRKQAYKPAKAKDPAAQGGVAKKRKQKQVTNRKERRQAAQSLRRSLNKEKRGPSAVKQAPSPHKRQRAERPQEVVKAYGAASGAAGRKAAPSGGQQKGEAPQQQQRGLPGRAAKPLGKFQLRHSTEATEDGGVKHVRTKPPLLKEVQSKWETLRTNATFPADRARLAGEILAAGKGSLGELARSHVGSRILQSCAKHGGAKAHTALMAELRPHLLELAKSSYGHFIARRLAAHSRRYGPKEELAGMLAAVKGRVGHLLRHPCGATVIDELYLQATAEQRNALAAELYGREFTLFPGDAAPQGLAAALEGAPGPKRRAVLGRVTALLHPLLEKGMVDPVLVHRLLAEYMAEAPLGASGDLLEALAGPLLLRIVHTRPGAQAGCNLFAWGAPRDRKRALKAFTSDVVWKMATDEWAHLVLLAALAHTDDTGLLSRTLLHALQANLGELCADRLAVRIPLGLLRPRHPRHLPPDLAAIVYPPVPAPLATGASTLVTGPADQPAAVKVEDDIADKDFPVGPAGEDAEEGDTAGAGEAPLEEAGGAAAGDESDKEGGMEEEEPASADEEGEEEKESGEGDGAPPGGAAAGAGAGAAQQAGQAGQAGEGGAAPAQPPKPPKVLGPPKRDPLVRRRELLGQGVDSFSVRLCQSVAGDVGRLLRTQGGANLVAEIACSRDSGAPLRELWGDLLAELHAEGVKAVRGAIWAAVEADFAAAAAELEGGEERLLGSFFGSRAVRHIVQSVGHAAADPLWGSLRGHVARLQGSPTEEKVLAAVWHACSAPAQAEAGAEITLVFGQPAEEWVAGRLGKGEPKPQGAGSIPPGDGAAGQGERREQKGKKRKKV